MAKEMGLVPLGGRVPRTKGVDPSEAKPAGGVRERILDAAVAVLRESGLQHLLQVQVSEKAGVRQSHLTYYFPTRQDLLEAVTARVVDGIAKGVRAVVEDQQGEGHGPLLKRLAAAIANLEHMRMFVAAIVEADGDPSLRAMLIEGTRRLEAVLAEALGGAEAKERARLVLAAIWGLGLYQFLIRPTPEAKLTGRYLSWVTKASRERTDARRRAPANR
jgi:AcrR family transcriptional regulator